MAKFSLVELKKFISDLKDPDVLIRGCKKYHEIEPRDIAYIVARKIISENPKSEYHVIAGIEILLLIWNAYYLQNLSEEVKRRLENDILEAYRKTKSDFISLENQRLESINLENPTFASKIGRIYKTFYQYQSIKFTGASKAIHLIHPDLFMMWDNEISMNYYKLRPKYRIMSETPDKCYVEFMKIMQEVAREILQQKTIREMWEMHPVLSKEPKMTESFSGIAIENLPKMLDECNYVKFKREINFNDIEMD